MMLENTEAQSQPDKPKRQKLKSQIFEMKACWKEAGFKGLYKRYGLKLFAIFFVYYLVRDLFLYVLLPWLIAEKLLN